MGKTSIIIQREFNERVRKRSFIITTVITPLLFVGVMVIMLVLANYRGSGNERILVTDGSGFVSQQLENNDRLTFEASPRSLEELKAGVSTGEYEDIFGILVISPDIKDNPRGLRLYTYKSSTMDIEMDITRQVKDIVEQEKLKAYEIENLSQILQEVESSYSIQEFRIDDQGNARESSSTLSMILAYLFGFLIYMFVFLYGGMVLQGVVEEKSSKVLEVMVSSVKPFQLMMGKILGIAAVAVTQFIIWVVVIFVLGNVVLHFFIPDMAQAASAMADGGMGMSVGMEGLDAETASIIRSVTDGAFLLKMLGYFLLFFIGGYLLYAAMFAAIGSAVDNIADSQQIQIPVTIPIFLALIVMLNAMRDPHGALAVWFSLIPLTSPIIMMARIPYGVPVWEICLSLVLLYATFIAVVWLAGKIYRVGIFMYGKKPTFREILKWSRYKY